MPIQVLKFHTRLLSIKYNTPDERLTGEQQTFESVK